MEWNAEMVCFLGLTDEMDDGIWNLIPVIAKRGFQSVVPDECNWVAKRGMIEIRNYLCSNINLFAYHIHSMIIQLYSSCLPPAARTTTQTNKTCIPSTTSLATSRERPPKAHETFFGGFHSIDDRSNIVITRFS